MWIGLLGLALLPWLEVRVMLAAVASRGGSRGSSLHPVALGFDLFLGALCIIAAAQLLGSCTRALLSSPDRPQDQKRRRSITSNPRASGLKWRETEKEPTGGHLLENEELAAALMRKKQFSEQEWHALGITDLRKCHYVTSGGSYFIPAEKCLCGSGKLFDRCHNPYYVQRNRAGGKEK